MPQFDVHRMLHGGGLVIDCQSDLHDHFDSRLVVPLQPSKSAPPGVSRLHPTFVIDSSEFVMATHLAAAVRRRELGPPIASLAEWRLDIVSALDVLITGV